MAYSNADFVWTPDESTPYDYTANLANMGSSIEEVVGPHVYEAQGTASILDSTNFEPYTAGNVLRATRNGKYVTLNGIWGVKTPGFIESQSSKIFAQLPVGFRPKYHFYQLMQGSFTTSWLLVIGPDGKISASRCSGTQAGHYWMPINVNFLAED